MPVMNGLETEKLRRIITEAIKKNCDVGKTVWQMSGSGKEAFKTENVIPGNQTRRG